MAVGRGADDASAFTGGTAVTAGCAEATVCTLAEEVDGGCKTGTPKERDWDAKEVEEPRVPLWATSVI